MIDVAKKKRIVLKLGTSTLTHKTGKLNIRRMTNLVRILSDLHNAGKELLLVSSGAPMRALSSTSRRVTRL